MRAPWIVTLVCGASGAGKSRVARPLAARYGVWSDSLDRVDKALRET